MSPSPVILQLCQNIINLPINELTISHMYHIDTYVMSDKIVPFRRPINWKNLHADDAEKIIKSRAQVTSNVVITTHAYERIEERGFLQADVYRILREGNIDSPPVLDKHGGWQAIVKKRIRGGREAGVVSVIFRESEDIIIITVMWVDL